MRVTIVTGSMLVNGSGFEFEFEMPNGIRAIQWYEDYGEIEYIKDMPNLIITDLSPYQYLIDAFNTEDQKHKDDAIQFEIERVESLTYADHRKAEYATTEDQLDDIFHNGIEGWKASVQAVKDMFPKT